MNEGETADGYRQTKRAATQAVTEAKTVLEKFGEAMEEDYRSTLKKFWQTVWRIRRGKQSSTNTVYSGGGAVEGIVRGSPQFRRRNSVFVRAAEHWTSSISSTGCSRVHGSLPNQSTCVLWTWRKHSTVPLMAFCGRCSGSTVKGSVKGCTVLVPPEQELGSHCLQ